MRIISGKYRGKKLLSPANDLTRPTADRVRQAIFNILENRFYINWQESKVLDAFAGTGAMGLEAFSRGATQVHFMEKNPDAFKILKENISSLNATVSAYALDVTACQIQSPHPMDVVFMDPPYHQNLISKTTLVLQKKGWIGIETLLVLEMGIDESLGCVGSVLYEKNYGKTKVIFSRHFH